jgi:hypothetical protein
MTDHRPDPSEPSSADDASEGSAGSKGLHHLEQAARELLAAGRSFIDATEEIMGQPDGFDRVMRGVRDFVGEATRSDSEQDGESPPQDSPDIVEIEIDIDPDPGPPVR